MPALDGCELEEEVRVGLDEPGRVHCELVGEVRERRVGVDLHAQGADDGVLDDHGLLGARERLALGAVALLAVVGHPVEVASRGGAADARRLHGAAGDDLERKGVGRLLRRDRTVLADPWNGQFRVERSLLSWRHEPSRKADGRMPTWRRKAAERWLAL